MVMRMWAALRLAVVTGWLILGVSPCWGSGLPPAQVAQQVPVCSHDELGQSVHNLRRLMATDTITGRSLTAKQNGGPSTSLHKALAEYMRAAMACMQPQANTKQIADALTQGLLQSAGNDQPPNGIPASVTGSKMRPEDDPFTVHFSVVVAPQADDGAATSQRIAILASIGPACGRRGLAAVFTPDSSAWRHEFTATLAPFSLIQGQTGSVQIRLSSSDLSGHWYLAVVSHEPSCRITEDHTIPETMANDWMRMQILRPVLHHSDTPLVFEDEFVADLSGTSPRDWMQVDAQPDQLELHYNGIRSNSGEEVFAEHRSYRIEAAGVERVRTAAITPVDFLALWLAAPWADALQWSDPAQAVALQPQHAALAHVGRGKGCCSLFRAVYRCGTMIGGRNEPKLIEISVLYPSKGKDSGERYFFLRQLTTSFGATDYQVERVSEKPEPECAGQNLLRHPDTAP